MILSDETIKKLQKDYKEYMSESDWYDNDSNVMYRNLLDTISDKDTTIQQLQQGFMPQLEESLKDKEYYKDVAKQLRQELVACENIMKSVLDNLYCMLPCGTAKDTQYGHIAVDALEKALEAMERMD